MLSHRQSLRSSGMMRTLSRRYRGDCGIGRGGSSLLQPPSPCLPPTTTTSFFHQQQQHRRYIFSTIRDVYETISGRKERNDPRRIQERKDLSLALIGFIHKRKRLKEYNNNNNSSSSLQKQQLTKKQIQDLIDETLIELNTKTFFDSYGNHAMRYELQQEMKIEISTIFQSFMQVLEMVPSITDFDSSNNNNKNLYQSILEKEQKEIIERLAKKDDDTRRFKPFLQRKLGAIQTVASYHGWMSSSSSNDEQQQQHDKNDNQIDGKEDTTDKTDDLGYNESSQSNSDVTKILRQVHVMNLCRSTMLRNIHGYSVLALKSTIPNGGRGIFVEGFAPAGSLLAFIPGEIWPRECLIHMSTPMMNYFNENNTNYQITIRGDDNLLDSRSSPYTVLDNYPNTYTNPWAIGHVCNHPPPSTFPNCRTVPINFVANSNTELTTSSLEQNFDDNDFMKRFIPNTFARDRSYFGSIQFDREPILAMGVGLQCTRDVQDEELYYDYRIKNVSETLPSWYHEVDTNAWENGL